jgi:hypothetical protein
MRPFTHKVWTLWVITKSLRGLGLAKNDNIMLIVSESLQEEEKNREEEFEKQ